MLLDIIWEDSKETFPGKETETNTHGHYTVTYRPDPERIEVILHGRSPDPGGKPCGLVIQMLAHKGISNLKDDQIQHGIPLAPGGFNVDTNRLPQGEAIRSLRHYDWWNHLHQEDAPLLLILAAYHAEHFRRISMGYSFNLTFQKAVALRNYYTEEEVMALSTPNLFKEEWADMQPKIGSKTTLLPEEKRRFTEKISSAAVLKINADNLDKLLKTQREAALQTEGSNTKICSRTVNPDLVMYHACTLALANPAKKMKREEQEALRQKLVNLPENHPEPPSLAEWYLKHNKEIKINILEQWVRMKGPEDPLEFEAMRACLRNSKPSESFVKSLHTLIERNLLPPAWVDDTEWLMNAWRKKRRKPEETAAAITQNQEILQKVIDLDPKHCIRRQVEKIISSKI